MSSLFNITEDLTSIIYQIEDNGGEINDELQSQLEITEENLKDKIDEYANVINSCKHKEDAIKKEIERLQHLKKVNSNLEDKLKHSVLNAITAFGNDGKSGNKTLNTTLHSLYTRNVSSCIYDDNVKNFIIEYFINYITELSNNNLSLSDIDIDYFIKALNNEINVCEYLKRKDEDGNIIPYHIYEEDLIAINCNINFKLNLMSLLKDKNCDSLNKAIDVLNYAYEFKSDISATTLKEAIKRNGESSLGCLQTNPCIIIK